MLPRHGGRYMSRQRPVNTAERVGGPHLRFRPALLKMMVHNQPCERENVAGKKMRQRGPEA